MLIFFITSKINIAGSIADNAVIYKKSYVYVPTTPPAELIESTNYTLDFINRKFIHIGIDPANKFNVAIHLITSSRHVNITWDFLRRLFSLMGNILSFILDRPEKYKRTLFLETDLFKLSSMVYGGENMLVIQSKTQDGCRVLLSRSDLIQLQNLENAIYETVVRKGVNTRALILKQVDEYGVYLDEKITQVNSPPKYIEDMKIFIKNVQVDQVVTSTPNLLSQLKMYAATQLAELWSDRRNRKNSQEVI